MILIFMVYVVQAVGPLYFALVDSRRQTNKILCNAGIRAMSVYFQIMEIFMMGFRYNTGYNF